MALKAGLVNQPPDDEEGLLYREIGRSKPAPQGICVVNSAGKVLDWTLMFDDDKSVLAFFDHAKERFAKFPDAKKPVAAEVYQKFPSQKRKDVADSGKDLPVLDRHPEGKHCPAEPPLRKGTVAVRLFGRALDKDGKPVADTVRQENYIEDRFNIAVETQEKLAKALAEAGKGPVKLPLEVTRQWVKQAYMGVLDVQPLDNPRIRQQRRIEKVRLRGDEGRDRQRTDVMACGGRVGSLHRRQDGKCGTGRHARGQAEVARLHRDGREPHDPAGAVRRRHGETQVPIGADKDEIAVALLPGGHRIDMACGVRYGILGEAVTPDVKQEKR